MIVLCAWCVQADEPAFLNEQPPYHDTRISHGICPRHRKEWTQQFAAHAAALKARQEEQSP